MPILAEARTRKWSQLEAVSEELVNAARVEDTEQSAWWGEQLVARLGDATSLLDQRQGRREVRSCDALAHLATLALGVPAAAVTLMVGDRVRIVGAAGVPAALDLSQGLPRARSFTHLVMETPHLVLVEDARTDSRLDGVLPVSTHGVTAVAGVPLKNPRGTTVGAFCAMDIRPHRWPPAEVAMLEDLAAVATRLLDLDTTDAAAAPRVETADELVIDDDIVDLVPAYSCRAAAGPDDAAPGSEASRLRRNSRART